MIWFLCCAMAVAGEWRLLTGHVESVAATDDGTPEIRIDRGKKDGALWQGRPYRIFRTDAQGGVVEVGRASVSEMKGSWTRASVQSNEGLQVQPGDRVVMSASVNVPASPAVAYDLALQGVDLVVGRAHFDWARVRAKPDAAADSVVCQTPEMCLALRWYAEIGAEALTVGPQDANTMVASWRAAGAPLASSDAAAALLAGQPLPSAPYGQLFAQRAWDALASGDEPGVAMWAQATEALAARTGSAEDRGRALLTEARRTAFRGDNEAALDLLARADEAWPEGRGVLLADAVMLQLFADRGWLAWEAFVQARPLGDLGMRWGFAGDAALDQARYAEAKDVFERCLRWHTENPDAYSVLRYGRCENGLAHAMIELGEADGAEPHVLNAFAIGEAWDNEMLRADANYTMGDWLAATRDFGKAAAMYEGASVRYEKAGNPRLAALARVDMARVGWQGTGVATLVVQVADEVLRLSREAGDDTTTVRALQVLGDVEMGLDDPRAAVALYEEAVAIAGERRWVALGTELLTSLAAAKLAANDAEGARAAYDAAVTASSGSPVAEAMARAARGRALGIPSELEAAAGLYENGGNMTEATIVWADLAEVHRRSGDLTAAAIAVEKAKAAHGNETALAYLAMVMGRVSRDQGDLLRAVELTEAGMNDHIHLVDYPRLYEGTLDWLQLQVALRDFTRVVEQSAMFREGAISKLSQQTVFSEDLRIGDVVAAEALMRKGQLVAAEQAAAAAGQQRLLADDREAEVHAQILLSEIAFHRGNRQAALTRAERAVKLLALIERPEPSLRVDAWGALVTAKLAFGDAPGALEAAGHAISAAATQSQRVNALRMRGEARALAGQAAGAEADLRAAVVGSDASVWPLHRELAATALAELLVANGKVADAVKIIDSVTTMSPLDNGQFDLTVWYRARLVDALVERASGNTAEANRLVADLEYGARDTGAFYWVARAKAFHDPGLDVWGEVAKLAPAAPPAEGTFRDVIVALEAAHADLADRVAVPVGQIEALGADLQPDEAMLVPIVLPDRVGLIVIRAGRIAWRETAIPEADVEALVRELRDAAQSPLSGYVRGVKMVATAETAPKADPAASSAGLYDLLVRPALADLDGVDTLVFAPAGKLRYVPIAALDDGERFLAERYTVGLLTASGSTTKHRALDRQAALLAMSNPDGSLPGATAEVQAIATTWGPKRTRVHDGPAATEEQLRADLGDVRLLHLATHGMLRSDSPRESYLLFAGPDGAEARLTLREITLLPLDRIDLAVLSACQTAVGELGGGQEIAGLAYQLEARGASAIVASLWPVDDASTSALMTAFYAELAKGTPRADALRKAQLAVLADERWRHPFYWAPFVVIGDWR